MRIVVGQGNVGCCGRAHAHSPCRRTEIAALLGTWLVAKDWRDLFPSKRNTASWSLLPHRVPRDKR